MSDLSPILSLPLMQAAQAQKHVTHNEALMRLDLLVQLTVEDRTRTAPPAAPAEGQRHIVAVAPTGDWAGQAGKIAYWLDGQWQFLTAMTGWRARVLGEEADVLFDGAQWVDAAAAAVPSVLSVDEIGVGTSSDAVNRLSVASEASLFSHQGTGHQMKINKAAAGQTASLLFQSNFSGRAEMGLVGENHFTINVSNNGSTFNTALRVTAGTAEVEIMKPVQFSGQTAGPSSPSNGEFWHDSTRGQLFARIGGQTRVIDQQADLPYLLPPSGEFMMTTMGSGGATTVLTGAANRMDIYPFVPSVDIAVDAMGVNCTTAVVGAECKLVVYEAAADGQPDALLLETAPESLATTGNKILPMSLSFNRGRTYWIGVRHSATAGLSAWALQATPDINGGSSMVTTARKTLRRTRTFALAAQSSWGFVNSEINAAVATAIWLRRA